MFKIPKLCNTPITYSVTKVKVEAKSTKPHLADKQIHVVSK